MCTVTYLPLRTKEYILTSNRDESVHRAAALPVAEYRLGGKSVFFPKDQKAQGTWIAHEAKGYTVCLLNGAFEPHRVKENYRKSRGLMLLDFFEYGSPEKFANEYEFDGIEPFTLVFVHACSDSNAVILQELKWNEQKPVLIRHDSNLPQIWSSVTLYSPEIRRRRENWFNEWLGRHNNNYTSDDILFFHHFAGEGKPEHDLLINRGEKKTVSVCCINRKENNTEIIYEDLANQKLYKNKVINC